MVMTMFLLLLFPSLFPPYELFFYLFYGTAVLLPILLLLEFAIMFRIKGRPSFEQVYSRATWELTLDVIAVLGYLIFVVMLPITVMLIMAWRY